MDIKIFQNIDLALLILFGWGITYILHSTAFYFLTRIAINFKLFRQNRSKEILWRMALFGGIFTASLQVIIGISLFSHHLQITGNEPIENQEYLSTAFFAESVALYTEGALNNKAEDNVALPDEAKALDEVPALENMLYTVVCLIGTCCLFLLLKRFIAHKRFIRSLSPLVTVRHQYIHTYLHKLCKQHSFSRHLVIKSSPHLQSPVALGFSRIYLPKNRVSLLEQDQLEGMLAHELAHLVRKDSIWILVYNLVEAILFFQPLNRLMRVELQEITEQLCDEWSVKATGNRKALAACLLKIAGWLQPQTPSSAMVSGMALHQGALKARIGNIINNNYMKTKKNTSVYAFLTFAGFGISILMAAPGFTLAPLQEKPLLSDSADMKAMSRSEVEPIKSKPKIAVISPAPQTNALVAAIVPAIKADTAIVSEASNVQIAGKANIVSAAQPGSTTTVGTGTTIYNARGSQTVLAGVSSNAGKDSRTHISSGINLDADTIITIRNGKVADVVVNGKKIPEDEMHKYAPMLERNSHDARLRGHRARARGEGARARMEAAKARELEASAKSQESEKYRQEAELHRQEAEKSRSEAMEKRNIRIEERQKQIEMRRLEAEERREEAEKRRQESAQFQELLEENLIGDNLIDDAGNYSFQFKNESMIVNGKKQAAEMYEKYKALYESSTGKEIGTNTSLQISICKN